LSWTDNGNGQTANEQFTHAILDLFGLDLVPGRAPIEMVWRKKQCPKENQSTYFKHWKNAGG
jgi:hypothetical protein